MLWLCHGQTSVITVHAISRGDECKCINGGAGPDHHQGLQVHDPCIGTAGAKVTVQNADAQNHTVTSEPRGAFDVNVPASGTYKKGDRKFPSMRGIAESLSDQDIADLAAYYSASGVVAGAELPAKPVKEASAEVQALLGKANCASCHGANFSKPIDPSYPKLAGQHADYLFVALKSYKTENNAKVGRGNAIMAGMVKQYTNAELKLLAGYLASVAGEVKTVPESRFR